MNLTESIKGIVRADGIHVTPSQYETAVNLQRGTATAAEVAGEVLEQMSPADDTPYVATWGELTMVALERLGAKVGVLPGLRK